MVDVFLILAYEMCRDKSTIPTLVCADYEGDYESLTTLNSHSLDYKPLLGILSWNKILKQDAVYTYTSMSGWCQNTSSKGYVL